MVNRRFTSLEPGGHTSGLLTLLDIINETLYLIRARWKYLLMLLSAFLLASIVEDGLNDYMSYTGQGTWTTYSNEAQLACKNNILQPWLVAALGQNLSASQQEEFYKSSQLNCSMYKKPVEAWGQYTLKNGSLQFSKEIFALAPHPVVSAPIYIILQLLCAIWIIWALVAIAWGLQVASTTTPSYNTRPIYAAPQKASVTDLIQEPFFGKLLRGVLRLLLTKILEVILMTSTSMFGATVLSVSLKVFAASFTAERLLIVETMAQSAKTNPAWSLAHPLLLLFLLSTPVAALEPGMWGFKALWRGVQLMKGNLWNSVLVHIMLSLWHWLLMYLITTARLKLADVMNESFWGLLLRSMSVGSLRAAADLPGVFLLPVFYFFCKSWREKAATMA